MRKIARILSVFLLLLGPLLIYFLLQRAGENHYELPVYFSKKDQKFPQVHKTTCLPSNYPYSIFDHPIGQQFARSDASAYLFYSNSTAEGEKKIQVLQKKMQDRQKSVQAYGPMLPKDSLDYVRDCVLHVSTLFGKEKIRNWAVLLDSSGYVRGFFDPNDEKDFRKGLAEIYILLNIH